MDLWDLLLNRFGPNSYLEGNFMARRIFWWQLSTHLSRPRHGVTHSAPRWPFLGGADPPCREVRGAEKHAQSVNLLHLMVSGAAETLKYMEGYFVCTRRSESPEISFFQHVKTGHLVWPSQKLFWAMHPGLRREENANRFFQRAHTSTVHWDTCKARSIGKGCYFLTCGGNALIISEFQL